MFRGISALVFVLGVGVVHPPIELRVDDIPAGPTVAVEGNRLVDGSGVPVVIKGVNRAGTEYACAQGWGIFDGPVDDVALDALRDWNVTAVRLPLNADCWLGHEALDPSLSGAVYRRAVVDLVDRLGRLGMYAVLDLHWTAAGPEPADGQEPMADLDAVEFWRSVASVIGDRSWTIFDLFNEPHDVDWTCWRDGCGVRAGMQQLVDAVRSTGSGRPIVVSGLDWGGDVRGWLAHRPVDPAGALVAGVHLYDFKRCNDRRCWNRELGTVAAEVPMIITEFGDSDCDGDFSQEVMAWADRVGVSYLAWAWNPWDCAGGPALIESFDGRPTPYGAVIREHLGGTHGHGRAGPPPRSTGPKAIHAVE